jgi:SET domain-containing protein
MTNKSTSKSKKKMKEFDQSQPKRGGPPIPTSPLVEVRNSEVHGRGVFAVADIAKGTRIFEYLGDRVSHAAADARYEDHDENDNHTFLFIVDRNTVIDAAVNGSDARFINHHCDGNCTSVIENRRVFIDAVRAIKPGEELGYDYEIGRDKDDRRTSMRSMPAAADRRVPRLHAGGCAQKEGCKAGSQTSQDWEIAQPPTEATSGERSRRAHDRSAR